MARISLSILGILSSNSQEVDMGYKPDRLRLKKFYRYVQRVFSFQQHIKTYYLRSDVEIIDGIWDMVINISRKVCPDRVYQGVPIERVYFSICVNLNERWW